MAYWYGEFIRGGSSKYYELFLEEGGTSVIAEFGRLPGFGRAMSRQRHVYTFRDQRTASSKFSSQRDEKIRKGYTTTRRPLTDQPLRPGSVKLYATNAQGMPLTEEQTGVLLRAADEQVGRFRKLDMEEGPETEVTTTSQRFRNLVLEE